MKIITFEDIEKDPGQKDLIDHLKKKFGTPIPEEIKKLVVDITIKSSIDVATRTDWLRRLATISNNIIANKSQSTEYPLFWIYLYGLIFEFYNEIESLRDFYNRAKFIQPLVIGMDALYNCFNDGEKSFVKYMRHSHVHISLNYLWHRTKTQDGKIVEVKDPIDPDIIKISTKILEDHNFNQQEVAKTFAIKIVDIINEIASIATALEQE